MKASRTRKTNTHRATTAALWCRNRRRMSEVWLRSRTVNSRSVGRTGSRGLGMSGATAAGGVLMSGIADPRVEDGVEQVGDEVADDHERAGDDEPPHRGVAIVGEHRR